MRQGNVPPFEEQPSDRDRTLDRFARRYGRALTRFFDRRVDRKDDIPDLVQDVFLRLSRLENLSLVKPEHYIFATAASALKDRARREIARRTSVHGQFDEMTHGGTDFGPDRIVEGKQALVRLQEAVKQLPERTRDVFVLRALEAQKMSEVANAIGISTRAAEKHYVKAIIHLAHALEGYCEH